MRSPSSLALYGMLGVATLMLQAFGQTSPFDPIIAIPFGLSTLTENAATQMTLPPAFTMMSVRRAQPPHRFAQGSMAPFGLGAMSLGGLRDASGIGAGGLTRAPAGLHWYVQRTALDKRR
jgi:hypothetical protein